MDRFKGFLFLSLLLASSNAFAGGGGGESGPLLSDEDWGALCSYTGYAILAVLALFAFGKFVAWVTAPCRETYRRARIWRDAMDALSKDDPPPESTSTVG